MLTAKKAMSDTSTYVRFDRDALSLSEVRATRQQAVEKGRRGRKQRAQAFILLILCGFVAIALIAVNAFSSKIQYDINMLNRQILAVERTVQNLEVKIQTANSIACVEAKALGMGMVYPSFEEMIYLDEGEDVEKDFALALRELAYE